MKNPLAERGIPDCWNHIGVYGNAQCEYLPSVYHCRNCPVYSEAGRKLLERKPPADYKDDWTLILGVPKEERPEGAASLLVFRVADEWLAMSTRYCREVTEWKVVHRIPHRSEGILRGVVNIRGEIQLCVSLEKLLEIGPASGHEDSEQALVYRRMVVAESEGLRWVFPVDEVSGITHVLPDDLQKIPSTVSKSAQTFTKALLEWNGKNVGCMDEELLFYSLRRSLS